jgi:hypothetical protein
MATLENLTTVIEKSDFPFLTKSAMKGFIYRANQYQEKIGDDRALIGNVSRCKVNQILLSTDEVKIYTISGNDEWDIKYPFRSIYFKDGQWLRVDIVSPTLDVAMLNYLQYKQLGANNDFANFAIKMLEIKVD